MHAVASGADITCTSFPSSEPNTVLGCPAPNKASSPNKDTYHSIHKHQTHSIDTNKKGQSRQTTGTCLHPLKNTEAPASLKCVHKRDSTISQGSQGSTYTHTHKTHTTKTKNIHPRVTNASVPNQATLLKIEAGRVSLRMPELCFRAPLTSFALALSSPLARG